MKKHFLILIVFGFILGCENSGLKIPSCPKSYFTDPFPKRSINLALRLGDSVSIEIETASEPILEELNDSLILKQGYQIDTVHLGISYDRKTKLTTITDLSDTDTIFSGYVSKYRGLYYMTEKRTDTTFWIGAMNIDFDSIQGFGMIREQMCDLENFAEQNLEDEIIQKADTLNGIFEFYADKKLIREIYPNLIENYSKLKIISEHTDYDSFDWREVEEKFANIENYSKSQNELVETLYPNPADDFIQLDFTDDSFFLVELIDNSGRLIFAKKDRLKSIEIPVNEFESGLYLLRVISPEDKKMETHRIIIR